MAQVMGDVMYWAGKVDSASNPHDKKIAEIGLREAKAKLQDLKNKINQITSEIANVRDSLREILNSYSTIIKELKSEETSLPSEEAKTLENIQTSDQAINENGETKRPRKLRMPGIKI